MSNIEEENEKMSCFLATNNTTIKCLKVIYIVFTQSQGKVKNHYLNSNRSNPQNSIHNLSKLFRQNERLFNKNGIIFNKFSFSVS